MRNGNAEYVIMNARLGCLCRWSEKDKTLYTAFGRTWSGAPTVFRSRNEARKARRAAYRFWNSPPFSEYGKTPKEDWELMPLRRKNAKGNNDTFA